MIALDNWRYMPVRLVIGPAGSPDRYNLEDMKFLARTQFGKRLVLLDALDASEVIPPKTGDGLEEKDGVKTSAQEGEEMPPGASGSKTGARSRSTQTPRRATQDPRTPLERQHQKCPDSRKPQRGDLAF
jgi:hypothetical protein